MLRVLLQFLTQLKDVARDAMLMALVTLTEEIAGEVVQRKHRSTVLHQVDQQAKLSPLDIDGASLLADLPSFYVDSECAAFQLLMRYPILPLQRLQTFALLMSKDMHGSAHKDPYTRKHLTMSKGDSDVVIGPCI